MKELVSIIIPTLGRETLYPLLRHLLSQQASFDYEIVLVPQAALRDEELRDQRIKVYPDDHGKGFAHYRNKGITHSRGSVIVFIDDDELPMNHSWLETIARPVLDKKEHVVTAGVNIPLGQGYFTDSVSLLGFPGGGGIGFRTMWSVDDDGYTGHLCSGNLAIARPLLEQLGNFGEQYKDGNEDVNLADRLIREGHRIKYEEDATVYHVARKGMRNFIIWNWLRGKSAGTYIASDTSGNSKVMGRVRSSGRIIKRVALSKPHYLPGVAFAMGTQYLCQGSAVILRKVT